MNQHVVNRRSFLRHAVGGGVAAVVLPGFLAACAGASTTAAPPGTGGFQLPSDLNRDWPRITSKEVVVAGFGGASEDFRRANLWVPFTTLSGASVVSASWDYGKFVSMVAAPKPEWDMMDFDGYSTVGLIEAGTAPGKLADWVRRCDLVDAPFRDYAGGGYAYSIALGWRSGIARTPASWADFFDTSAFPGKRAFPKSIYLATAEAALMADGVDKNALYPLDFDRAFARLDTIKDSLVFYESYAQAQQLVVQGSVDLILAPTSRLSQLQATGDAGYTFDQAVMYPWSSYALTANAPHSDAANALIDTLSHPQVQAEVARRLLLGPTTSAALDLLTPQELAVQPSAPDNVARSAVVDTAVAAEQDADYVERFTAWIGQ